MEIMPVETKKRIHEFSYAQKVSNQISPDKSHIKLNESLFKAKIMEKQSCTLIKDIQKDLQMKIQKYDSLLKQCSTFQNISNSQPNSPPLKQNQEEFQEVTQQQNQIQSKAEKLLQQKLIVLNRNSYLIYGFPKMHHLWCNFKSAPSL